jgi:hypothetical protein
MRSTHGAGIVACLVWSACAPAPRLSPAADPRWLGCYVVSWTERDGAVTDSLQLLLGRPTRLPRGPGFRPAWPDSPEIESMSVTFGGTVFVGPVWTAAGDSLVISWGFMSSWRVAVHERSGGLTASVHVEYDSGPISEAPFHYTYAATVQRAACAKERAT